MKNFNCLLFGAVVLSSIVFSQARAQNVVFDPLLDPACKIISAPTTETWKCSYMWYPGLLAAHTQRIQKEKSDERCVNVDYPGNFMKDSNRSFFRKEIKLSKETEIYWNAPKAVTLTINGKEQDPALRKYKLAQGTHNLIFNVQTTNRLPALIVRGGNIEALEGWQVSLDGQFWNLPETDSRYNKPAVFPDDAQETRVTISPDNYIFLRNAINKNGKLELGENASLLVDFRHLEVGNVIVQVSGEGKISFSVGESPEETLNEDTRGFEQKFIKPFTLTDKIQEITLPERALRYLKISCSRPCTISSIRFEAKVWPVDFQMQFESDNKSLNNLWNAGIATLHTSTHNFYLDGVKRDYLPWAMDAIVCSLGGDYLFGDQQVTRNGISISLLPPNPQESDWGVVDYPFHALIGLKHEYMRYKDLNTSLMFKDRIIQQFAFYESAQDKNGFISAEPPTWGFIPGWSKKMGPDSFGTPTYGQMMLYQNFLIGAYFATLWKDDALARHYEQKAKELSNNIITHFWDNESKAFINGYLPNGEKDYRISHYAQYWGILTGLYPEKHYNYLFDRILTSIPFYKEYVSYEKSYEYLAYIKAGRTKEIFAQLDNVWGDWLRQGNTRFPENFSPGAPLNEQLMFYNRPFGLSLCHGANGMPPIIAILHGIYGFSQSDKNLSEYTLRPDLHDLNWVKGRIPVKEGYINIHWVKQGTCSVEIPENCIVRLYPDKQNKPLEWKKAGTYTFQLK